MKSSPLLLRQGFVKSTLNSEVTPKRRTKGSTSKNKSPLSNSSISWSSRKGSSKKINLKHEVNSYETFYKELIEYQTACVNNSLEYQASTTNFKFSENSDYIGRKNLMKCKMHEEDYSFFSIDDKRFLCTKCLYNKYEKLVPGGWKTSVLPIEKCNEFISQENNHFVEVECQQYLRQLQRTISVCNHNNNFLVERHEIFQTVIANEFNTIYDQLKKKEEELLEQINTFFDNSIKENIGQLQNFKFLLDNIHKVREFGKHKTLEQNVLQFSFASKLKRVLENIDLNIPKFVQKDMDIIGSVTKERVKKEIDKIGKPLPKCLETLTGLPKRNMLIKSPNESRSPIKGTKKYEGESSTAETQKKSVLINDKRDYSSKKKPSPEYIRIKELEALINSDFTQILPSDNQYFDDSNILVDNTLREEALRMFPININRTKKLYCLSKDGASSQVFHQRCDGHGPYLVIVKTEGKHIFGYFCPMQFLSNDKYCGSETFWIFSLKNIYGRGIIFKIKPEKNFIALYNSSRSPCLGSTIKGKEDLFIDFDNLTASCSNVGYAYKLWDTKLDGTKVLSGKPSGWNFDEIEIYQVEE